MEAGAVNAVSKVEWSTAKAFRGKGSLAVTFNGMAGTSKVFVAAAPAPSDTPVDFHVWIPAGSQVISVQAYASLNSVWVSKWVGIKDIPPGAWKALQIVTPPKYFRWDLGLVFTVAAGFTGTVYVDTVGWPGNVPPGADAGSFPEGGTIGPDGSLIFTPATGAGGSQSTGGATGAGGASDTTGGLDPNAVDDTSSTAGGCAGRGAPGAEPTP